MGGTLVVGDFGSNVTVRTTAAGQLTSADNVYVNGAMLDLNGFSTTIGSPSCAAAPSPRGPGR